MNPDEYKLMAHATRVRPNIRQQNELRRLLPRINDKDRLIQTALKEALAGLYYINFKKSDALKYFSDDQQASLRTAYYRAVQFNLLLIRDLKEILSRLELQGLEVVLLQGIDLLDQVYADVGSRPLTDIDLWVKERDCPALKNVLAGLGYRAAPRYPLTFRRGATVLDVHTHLLWADRIEARRFLLAKTQDHIFRHTRREQFEGLTVRRLGIYDRVIYLSLHLLKHDAQRLVWLVDIQNLVAGWEASDWEALRSRAKQLGQVKGVAAACFLLERLLDFRPAQHRAPVQKTLSPLEKKVLRQRIKKGRLPPWSSLLFFSSSAGLKQRLAFIFETLFPRPEILRQVFPDAPGSDIRRLYVRRIRQLIGLFKKELPFF